MNSKLYFPNGCNICGSEVELLEEESIYKCSECEASVTYHHKNTDNSRKYEPLGYLAGKEVNRLRIVLKNLLPLFWSKRIHMQTDKGIVFTAPINVVFPKFIVKVDYMGDYEFGTPISKKENFTNVLLLDLNKSSMFEFSELEHIHNRDKTYVWLATAIGVKAKGFRIGYLDSDQLLRLIEICNEHESKINAIKVGDPVGVTDGNRYY